MPFTVGSGFEYETDHDQSQYDYPLFLEYNVTERFKLAVEPALVSIESKTKDVRSVSGYGDTETSAEYEFLRELRYRPALTAEGVIKWPTASDPDLGSPGEDYSVGLIMAKDLVFMDVDLNALYTFVGDPKQKDIFELSMAADVPLNYRFSIEAEVVKPFGGDGGNATEGTLALAWHATKHLKLEVGGKLRTDGTWQFLSAWEYSFAGED